MAYEMNDLQGFFLLVLLAIPMIASTNIDCSGKAFHCVNSTHFMICVDLGGGVSTTIDDFVISCPPTTVCHKHNIFECEFPKIEVTTPPLQVIGVSKQSYTSETNSVNYSVTDPTPPDDVLDVLKENVTVKTLPIPEEVTPVLNLEVLENLKQRTGAISENTTETSMTYQVSSSPNFNSEQSNNITNDTIFATDNKNFESAEEISIDKTVTASFTDKSKSIYTTTSIIGLIDLISTDPQSVANKGSSSDALTALNTSYNTATTIDSYATKQETVSYDKNENITDQKSTTPMVDTYIQIFNKDESNNKINLIYQNDSVSQNLANQNSVNEINTTEPSETNTKYFAPNKIDIIPEPATAVSSQITTEKYFGPLGFLGLISTDPQTAVNSKSSFDVLTDLKTSYDNTATTIEPHMSKQAITFNEKIENVTDKISYTPAVNTYFQTRQLALNTSYNTATTIEPYTTNQETVSYDKNENITDQKFTTHVVDTYIQIFNKDESNNKINLNNHNNSVSQNLANQDSVDEITTTEPAETNTKYFAPNKIDIIPELATALSSQITTEKYFGPLGFLGLISTDPQTVVNSKSSFDVLTELKTSYDNTATTIEPHTSKQAIRFNEKIENVTDKINKTLAVNTYFQTFDTGDLNNTIIYNNNNDLVNQIFANQKSIDEITTTEQLPETNTKYFALEKQDLVSEPVTVVISQTTTEEAFVPLELLDLMPTDPPSGVTTKSPSDVLTSLNTSNDNTATTIEPYTTKQAIILNEKIENVTDQKNYTPAVNTFIQTFEKDDINNTINFNNDNASVNQNFANQKSIDEITTTEQVPETNTKYFTLEKQDLVSEPVTVVISQMNTEKTFVPLGILDLMATNPQSEVNTKPPSDVLTSLSTSNDNTATTIEPYTTKQAIILNEKIENVTDLINNTPAINTVNQTFDKDDINNSINFINQNASVNQNFAKNKSLDEITTTEQVTETTTKYFASDKIDFISEPATVVSSQITKENTFVPLGLIDLMPTDSQSTANNSISNLLTALNTSNDINATTVNFSTNTPSTKIYNKNENATDIFTVSKVNILSENSPIMNETSTTPMAKTYIQSFDKADINNKNNSIIQIFVEPNSIGKITTTEQVPSINKKYVAPDYIDNVSKPMTIMRPLTRKERIIYTTTSSLDNGSIDVDENTTAGHPLEIIKTTESPKEFTDNSYQIYKESHMLLNATKNNMTTIQKQETVYNVSSTEPTLLLTSTIKNISIEIPPIENLQNQFTVYKIEGEYNELSATTTPLSLGDTHTKIEKLLNTHSTFPLHNASSTSQFNISINASTDTAIDPLLLNSDGFTSLGHGKTEKLIVIDEKLNNQGTLNQADNIEIITLQETLHTEQSTSTVQASETTINWDHFENLATTPYPRDVSEKASVSDSVNSRNASNVVNEVPKIVLPRPPLSNHYETGFSTYKPNIAHTTPTILDSVRMLQAPNNIQEIADKIKSNSTFPLDTTHNTNIEEVSGLAIKTIAPQESTIQEMDKIKGINATRIATEAVSKMVPPTTATAGYVILTANNVDLNASNWKESLNIKLFSTVNQTDKINKTEIIKPSFAANIYNDKTFNSTVNLLQNGSIYVSSLTTLANLSLSDDFIKTTESQDSSVYPTTTDYSPSSKLIQVGESVSMSLDLQKSSQAIQNLTNKNLMNSVLSTASLQTPSTKEINTENVNYLISTEASLPRTIGFDQIIPSKSNELFLPKESISTENTKVPYITTEATTSVSGFTPETTVSADVLKTGPVYVEGTIIGTTASTTSSTQITFPQNVPVDIKNIMELSKESSLVTSQVIGTQKINYNSKNPSLPTLGAPAAQITKESIRTTYVFTQTTITPMTLFYGDVLPGIKTTGLPVHQMSTVNYNDLQSTGDVTTEPDINLVTQPDSMVETIKVNGDKISGTSHGDMIFSAVMINNRIVNNTIYSDKSVKNMINHENIVIGSTSKNITQNRENVNQTEIDRMQTNVDTEIDSVKKIMLNVNDSSIEDESTIKPSDSKFDMDLQNRILSTYSPLAEITTQDGTTVDIVKYELTTVTKSLSTVIENGSVATANFMQPKTVIIKENQNVNTDSSVNTNNKISDEKQDQFISFGNISHNINKKKVNITASYNNLSLHNSTINDNLEQHLISTNHTVTTEIQSHINESDKQSNKTSNKPQLNGTSMHNPNFTTSSIQLNAGSKEKTTINIFASFLNCSNRTRGKYADKKDCRKFYICVGKLQPLIGTCPNNTVFSEINKQCTRNLSHCVRNNQFRCLFEGRFSDFFKDNIYYICIKNSIHGFVRYKLQCQNDYHLNKDLVKCEKNIEVSSQSVSSVSENSKINTEESKPEVESKKIINSTDFECEKEGKFPHPNDCTKYYVCTKSKNEYRRKLKKCESNDVYDKNKKKCVETDSNEC